MVLVELQQDAVVGEARDAGVLERLGDRVLEGGRDQRVDERPRARRPRNPVGLTGGISGP